MPLTIAWVLLIVGGAAFTNIIYVPADYLSIQEAIDISLDGDEIIVDMCAYEYQANGCPADITGVNGMSYSLVDVHDLLALLGKWGPCP